MSDTSTAWRYDDPPHDKEIIAAWRVGNAWIMHPVIYCEEREAFFESWRQEDEIKPERWTPTPALPE